jgi:hypothetical protein
MRFGLRVDEKALAEADFAKHSTVFARERDRPKQIRRRVGIDADDLPWLRGCPIA